MKSVFIFLLLIFASCAQNTTAPQTVEAKKQSEREKAGFVGNVKMVSVEWSPISGDNVPAGSKCPTLTDVYDESGKLIQHSVYSGRCGE